MTNMRQKPVPSVLAFVLVIACAVVTSAFAADIGADRTGAKQQVSTQLSTQKIKEMQRDFKKLDASMTTYEAKTQALTIEVENFAKRVIELQDWQSAETAEERVNRRAAYVQAASRLVKSYDRFLALQSEAAAATYNILHETLKKFESADGAASLHSRAVFARTAQHFERLKKSMGQAYAAAHANPDDRKLRQHYLELRGRVEVLNQRLSRMSTLLDNGGPEDHSNAVTTLRNALHDLRGFIARLNFRREEITYLTDTLAAKAASLIAETFVIDTKRLHFGAAGPVIDGAFRSIEEFTNGVGGESSAVSGAEAGGEALPELPEFPNYVPKNR